MMMMLFLCCFVYVIEAREHGVGFYAFSRDEAERAKQMEELEQLRRGTEASRAAAATTAVTKRQALDARLKKIRDRKRQKLGLPPLSTYRLLQWSFWPLIMFFFLLLSVEEKPVAQEPPPPPTVEEAVKAAERVEEEEERKKRELAARSLPKTVKIRPWDMGKEGVPTVQPPGKKIARLM